MWQFHLVHGYPLKLKPLRRYLFTYGLRRIAMADDLRLRNVAAFFCLGFTFSYKVLIDSAMQDILSGSAIPSTVIVVLLAVPYTLLQSIAPWFVYKVSFLIEWTGVTVLFVISVGCVSVNLETIRLIGVVLNGSAIGLTSALTMAMIAKFPKLDVLTSVYRTGAGAGGLAFNLIYTGLTTWTCTSPQVASICSIPFCCLPLLSYWLLDKRPLQESDSYSGVKYTKVDEKESQNNNLSSQVGDTRSRAVVALLYAICPLAGYLYLSKLSKSICLSALLTSVAFPNAPFLPRDHFQYYHLLFSCARLLGGAGPIVTSRSHPDLQEFFKIRRMWILAVLDVVPIFLFLLTSWYRFITDYRIIFVICFAHGIVSGMMAVFAVIATADHFGAREKKGIAMGLVEVSTPAANLVAGIVGAVIEPLLKEHCTEDLLLGAYCSTRFASATQWAKNLHCTRNK
ncbi:predicted protein [Nematostella vectensis]|uniref:Battenin n=1 Tax=Nematostella vectensis TaxID=45351 RepID=A7RNB6_NEMVE|nr:uncharacterized protein LOC5519260 [Nematostella vectensis]EDO47113.1 predicted protein [Nematostella vectensis]|eukprot:XP_001639176.1 predicted protein [Nematostella vectensis]